MTTKARIKHIVLAGFFVLTVVGMVGVAAVPAQAAPATKKAAPKKTATPADCSQVRFLTFPAWYRGLAKDDADGNCNVMSPTDAGGLQQYIAKIILNVLEILLQLVGYVSISYIIYGGFLYITSQGESGAMVSAKAAIRNAVVGLVLSMMSVGIVNIVAGVV